MPTEPEPSLTNDDLRPRVPSNSLVMAANAALQDPNFRASVRQMHAERYPLVKMVEALGLEDDMTPQIKKILEELPDHVVHGIRRATLQMFDSSIFSMPLDCMVTDAELAAGSPVEVEVLSEQHQPTIHVRPGVTD